MDFLLLPHWNGLAGALETMAGKQLSEKRLRRATQGRSNTMPVSAARADGVERPVAGKSRHKKAPDDAGAFELLI